MMITPQACRRITGAVETLADPSLRTRWGAWTQRGISNQFRSDVPYEVAAIALDALTADSRRIEELLKAGVADENLEADLLNDLGYVRAIETSLRNEGVGR
jgi:hypothetical protein